MMWNILFDKIPIGSNLMKRSIHDPFWCHLCRNEEENTDHLLLHCPTANAHWNSFISHYPSLKLWQGHNILDAWKNGKSRNMPLLVCWSLWIARNHSILYHKIPHWPTILLHTIADYDLSPKEDSNGRPRHPHHYTRKHRKIKTVGILWRLCVGGQMWWQSHSLPKWCTLLQDPNNFGITKQL